MKRVSLYEHLSGLFQAIVAACCHPQLSSTAISKCLEINWKTANKAKTKRQQYDNNPSILLLIPPTLKKNKLSVATELKVKEFIQNNITPSSSEKNVRTKKHKGNVETEVKHWRTETIEELYDHYIAENEEENSLSFSAFYSRIPWFVHLKPKRTGLCSYHDKAYRIMQNLEKLRKEWHHQCVCQCIFCSVNGCNHGIGKKECLEGLCNTCKQIVCPLENSNTICTYSIVEYSYEKTIKGNKKLKQTTNTYSRNRKEFMTIWKSEMEVFKIHSDHCKYHKKKIEELHELMKKDKKMVIARWDFAENYVHESASMVSSEHYGKEQSQLLIATCWFHDKKKTTSTNNNDSDPNVKIKYYAFVSDYLSHSTLFFKKCFSVFLEKIKTILPFKFESLYLLSDGSQQHFKNKRSFNNMSLFSQKHSK